LKKIIIMIIAMALAFAAVPAFAADNISIMVRIPVENHGRAGWFSLFEGGELIDEVLLGSGESGYLNVRLTTLDYFTFKICRGAYEDGSQPQDETDEYTVRVTTMLDGEVPVWTSYAQKAGEEGKTDKIAFYTYELLPSHTGSPQTGDRGTAIYVALMSAALAVSCLVLGPGRRGKAD